jgi:hypothetical protein
MEVDQMLHHLNLACGGSLGFYNLPDESYLISRTVFKWILVDWFPEQPVGLRLPAGFKIPHSQRFEFADEKAQLLKILEAAWNARTADAWMRIPMMSISHSDLMPIRSERSDAGLSHCEIVIGISQDFCLFFF